MVTGLEAVIVRSALKGTGRCWWRLIAPATISDTEYVCPRCNMTDVDSPPKAPLETAASLASLVARLRRVLRSSVRSEIPWERLPMAQVELLQRLAEEPGLRVGELAARQHLATNTVSNLVQQMVEGGLVERRPDPQDRRAQVLQPTTSGLRDLAGWQKANAQRIESALRAMDAADREALVRALPTLAQLVHVLEVQAGEPPATGAL